MCVCACKPSYGFSLTDAQWTVIEPLLPVRGPRRAGRPLKFPRRLVVDTVLYVLVSGCAWRLVPLKTGHGRPRTSSPAPSWRAPLGEPLCGRSAPELLWDPVSCAPRRCRRTRWCPRPGVVSRSAASCAPAPSAAARGTPSAR
ncbi:transposase [Kitasatospora sp. NPDC058115]|uniref:transposase n=1 Tax=Kitasatospora sp. NPDC058115 TaxID=3346347 RepID=UPI0036D9DF17